MNQIGGFIGLVLGLGLIVWVIFLEIRFQKMKNLWVRSALAAKDADIQTNIANLSDAELNALLEKRIYPNHGKD